MIQITSIWDDVEDVLDRMEKQPTAKMRAGLGAVLSTGFEFTQAAVHEETGALKASGRKDTSYERLTHEWEGTITYGDEQGPVDYAIYERRRGVHWAGPSSAKGDHDFLRPLDALDPMWVAVIKAGLS